MMTEKGVIVTGYKATDKDMRCRGFQFELGKWYEHAGDIELCKAGFHFCEHQSGPWSYYSDGRLFKIEAELVKKSTGPGADLKHVAKKIRLIEEIEIDGDMNTGNMNTGDRNTGDGNTGDRNTGHWNTGYMNTGNENTGNRNTGDRDTGDMNTGNENTGYMNTGNENTGNMNTGNENTGYRNTGDWNTGHGNVGDYHAGCLCSGDAPFFIFNLPADRSSVDFDLVEDLCLLMSRETEFDPTPYLSLPNATPERIKALHDAHKEARRKAKSGGE